MHARHFRPCRGWAWLLLAGQISERKSAMGTLFPLTLFSARLRGFISSKALLGSGIHVRTYPAFSRQGFLLVSQRLIDLGRRMPREYECLHRSCPPSKAKSTSKSTFGQSTTFI